MAQLINLPGTDGRPRTAERASSVTGAIRVLRHGLVATSSGDNGAINLYRDDAGEIRVAFYRRFVPLDERVVDTVKQAKNWLRHWWHKMK